MKISNLLKSGLASLALAGALLAGCSNSNGPKPGSYTGVFILNQTITAASVTSKADPSPTFLVAGLLQATVSDSGTASGAITLFDSSLPEYSITDMPNPALFGHTYLFSGDADSTGFSFAPDVIDIYGTNYHVTGDATFSEDGSITGTLSGTVTDVEGEIEITIGEISGAIGAIPNGDTKYMSVACGGFGFSEDGVGGTEGPAAFIMHDSEVFALLASPEFTGTLRLSYNSDDFTAGPCSVETGCGEGDGTLTGTADIPADGGDGYTGDVTLPASYGFYQDQDTDWQTHFTYYYIDGSLGEGNTGFLGGFGGDTENCMNGEMVSNWWND